MSSARPVRSYYEILQVETDADWIDIKRKYNKLALKYHPDRRGADDKWAEAQFLAIQAAYETLKDETARKKYDADMGFNKPKPKEDIWAASAAGAYGDSAAQLDMSVNDQLYPGEEIKAIYGGKKPWVYVNHGACHVQDKEWWSNGVFECENPDGTFKVFWPEFNNYSNGMTRDKIRKPGETPEDAKMALERHERRMREKECTAMWKDGRWYPGYVSNVHDDNTYDIYWPEFKNTTRRLARDKIKFQHQLQAEQNRDTYTKFFQTGDVELYPQWESMKKAQVLTDVQKAIKEGLKLYARLKNMKPEAKRETYFIIEERRWDTHKMKTEIGIEKFASGHETYDTSNPRGWSEEELIDWIENKFSKPTIVKKLSAFATTGITPSQFFIHCKKPANLKAIGIKMKSLQKKVLAAVAGMNLTVW